MNKNTLKNIFKIEIGAVHQTGKIQIYYITRNKMSLKFNEI